MALTDIALYISVALLYNLLIHNLAAISYKDYAYDQKILYTTIMLILFGALAILISKFINERNKELKDSFISIGLFWGGILLIVTAVFANWDKVTDEAKLLVILGLFGGLIWYGYRRNKEIIKKKEEEGKINAEIINELVPD